MSEDELWKELRELIFVMEKYDQEHQDPNDDEAFLMHEKGMLLALKLLRKIALKVGIR